MSKTYREIEHLFIKCQEFFSSFSKRYILWPSSVAVHYVGQILKVYFWNFKIFVNLCSLWNFFLRDFEISSTSSRYSSEKFSRIHQQICQPWKYSIILRTNRLASHIGCDIYIEYQTVRCRHRRTEADPYGRVSFVEADEIRPTMSGSVDTSFQDFQHPWKTVTYFFFWITHVPKRMYPHLPIASELSSISWEKSLVIIFPSFTKILE